MGCRDWFKMSTGILKTERIGGQRVKEKVLLSWSGGKDSALALHELQKKGEYEVSGLLTTVSEEYDRINMHGVRRTLLENQAESLGLPLEVVYIPRDASNEVYENRMKKVLEEQLNKDISSVVFGDIFLEDAREHREKNLSRIGMNAIFPLWESDTAELARRFINLRFRAVVTCVDSKVLPKEFVGIEFDRRFLSELPSNVDPCGENGEFHTFVYDGPVFEKRISFKLEDVVLRENRFFFCDLVPR
jgi:uncharacterized protein (TIGR00290 family)